MKNKIHLIIPHFMFLRLFALLDAICMQIIVIGELLKNLDKSTVDESKKHRGAVNELKSVMN
jgi:hypothetical protein